MSPLQRNADHPVKSPIITNVPPISSIGPAIAMTNDGT
jgi:hypothetical protein